MLLIGEIAGILTSIFFAINAVVVTKAGQKVGSLKWIITDTGRLCVALSHYPKLHFISSAFAAPKPGLNTGHGFRFRASSGAGVGGCLSLSSLSDGRRVARDFASESRTILAHS